MKVLGIILVVVAFCAIDTGGGITFGLIAMIVGGLLCIFPQLLQYLFEGNAGERK
jgi:hypothetical protein